jgi:hypothetical protein
VAAIVVSLTHKNVINEKGSKSALNLWTSAHRMCSDLTDACAAIGVKQDGPDILSIGEQNTENALLVPFVASFEFRKRIKPLEWILIICSSAECKK